MAGGSLLSSVPEMMEWGLGGPSASRGRAIGLRLGSVLMFLAAWSLVSGVVVFFKLFNPIKTF